MLTDTEEQRLRAELADAYTEQADAHEAMRRAEARIKELLARLYGPREDA